MTDTMLARIIGELEPPFEGSPTTEQLEAQHRRMNDSMIAFRFKRLVPLLDDAVNRGDLGAIHEVRAKMVDGARILPPSWLLPEGFYERFKP
jgi:hypothetical protein